MKKLAILGAGHLGQQILHHCNDSNNYTPVCFFDDSKDKGKFINGLLVIGSFEDVITNYNNGLFDCIIIAVGYLHYDTRLYLYNKFYAIIPFASILHSSSYIDSSWRIGNGVFIYPGCILDSNVCIEDNVIINIGCKIAHDSLIKKHTILAPGVNIAGFVQIGESIHLGIGTVVIDNITICNNVKTGGGSVVINNINEPGLFYGIPAKKKPL